MKKVLAALVIVSLFAPIAIAGKKKNRQPKVIPDPKPDTALVYLCSTRGYAVINLDDALLGAPSRKKECTYKYVDPGAHFLWRGDSRFVEPLVLSVVELDFEAGETYYFSVTFTATMTWGNKLIPVIHVLPEDAGRQLVADAVALNSEPTKKNVEAFKKFVSKYDPDGMNNALIASRRLEQGYRKVRSAEGKDRLSTIRDYEEAVRLFGIAADKFDELAQITKKRKRNSIWAGTRPLYLQQAFQFEARNPDLSASGGVGAGPAYASISEIKDFKSLIAAYERYAAEARTARAEHRRRLDCYNRSEDNDIIAACVATKGSGRP